MNKIRALWIATWPIPSSVIFCSLIFKWINCVFKKGGLSQRIYLQKLQRGPFLSENFWVFHVRFLVCAWHATFLKHSYFWKTIQTPLFLFKVKQWYHINVFIVLTASTTLSLHPVLTNQRIYFHSQCILGYYFLNSSILRLYLSGKKKTCIFKSNLNYFTNT